MECAPPDQTNPAVGRNRLGFFVAYACHPPRRQRAPGSWLAITLRPYLGEHLLHLNAEAYGLATDLAPRGSYVACVPHLEGVQRLTAQVAGHPHLRVCHVDPQTPDTLPLRPGGFDTILWVRPGPWGVTDAPALRGLSQALAPHGRIVLLQTPPTASAHPDTLTRGEAASALQSVAWQADLTLRQRHEMARLQTPVQPLGKWCKNFGFVTVPVLRDAACHLRLLACRLDPVCPWPGAYAVAVLTHRPHLVDARGDDARRKTKLPASGQGRAGAV